MGKTQTDVDKEKFEQYKRDHPEQYYPMPEGAGFLRKTATSPQRSFYYFKRLIGNYGLPFFLSLTSTYVGVKGFLYSLIVKTQSPYFQQYLKVSVEETQIYSNIAGGPWAMKGFFGALSDLLPIVGYRKKWWLIIFATFGGISWLGLSFFPITKETGIIAAFLFFFANCHIAGADLLVEGQYAQLMRENTMAGPDIVTWVWVSYFIGSFIAIWVVGPFADLYRNSCNDAEGMKIEDCEQNFIYMQIILISGIPMSLQNIIPFALNWLGETRIPEGERGFQTKEWNGKNRPLYIVAITMGVCALLNVIMQVVLGKNVRNLLRENDMGTWSQLPVMIWSFVVGAFMIGMAFRLLPRIVAKSTTYMFLSRALALSIIGTDQWYVAKPDCIPNGPNLDNKFVQSVSGTAEAIAGLLGTALFQSVMGGWTFRPCFWVTTAVQCVGSFWDIVVFLRWNVDYLGIPDKVALIVGNYVIQEVVGMLDFMPGVVLTSKLCPKGAESTMYAILAGFSNFGRAIGKNFGLFVIPLTGLAIHEDPTPENPCNDDPLWYLILIGQIIMPMLTIPLTFWLIPDARLTGVIVDEYGNVYPPVEAEEEEVDLEAKEVKEASDTPSNAPSNAPWAPEPAQLGQDQVYYNPYGQPMTTPTPNVYPAGSVPVNFPQDNVYFG